MNFDDFTLDPPGSIAVVGAGPLGIEAALYGRFLGYNVTLMEAKEVGHSMAKLVDDPFPMMPHQCLSSLAVAALQAQSSETIPLELPISYRDWIDRGLMGLVQCDLLAGRLRTESQVTRISRVAPEPASAEAAEDDEDVPPDFRLSITTKDAPVESMDVESLVLAVGAAPDLTETGIELDFPLPAPYLFRIGETVTNDLAKDLDRGRRQITALFAHLGGRADLDLYRPRRV
ncbi:hypothetical protein [Novipirellula artificiosorum]|uniref:Dihydrolipoyl dehydrogenase n=1 Tax=Novipirellula artificiosorum TaxID=2528016 RepID=A0A5C6D6T2_9BACT|nr:hypothetical protein [Novipirellula artificiosorum]TWU31534.1 hypothetical protein Poly41_60900 [Novipirellula artificiosorum]